MCVEVISSGRLREDGSGEELRKFWKKCEEVGKPSVKAGSRAGAAEMRKSRRNQSNRCSLEAPPGPISHCLTSHTTDAEPVKVTTGPCM